MLVLFSWLQLCCYGTEWIFVCWCAVKKLLIGCRL